MKNFPHQFNDIQKLFNALAVAKELIDKGVPLTDENFGEQLTRNRIYTYRNKSLSIEQFLEKEKQKTKSNRGYLTVSRDIRRFFELLGFLVVFDTNKNTRVTTSGKQLLMATSDEDKVQNWKDALLQLGLEGTDGEISHPYKILLHIVNSFPGIETSKLMLALEAKNDSEEEIERINTLAKLDFDEIINEIGVSEAMAKNAVKILPGIAKQLNDIEKISNKVYPISRLIVNENEISTEKYPTIMERAAYRRVTSDYIAKDPKINYISSMSIDLSSAIKVRQKRLREHQEIVRKLAELNEDQGFQLFEGKFDCLGIKGDDGLLYEVKTILENAIDQEKQTVKGVGQLKYYNFSIVEQQMGKSNIKELLVFSMKPNDRMIEFCIKESIMTVWKENDSFKIFNPQTKTYDHFNPSRLIYD
jgi:hypothetical protein